jgi:threonine aldolase
MSKGLSAPVGSVLCGSRAFIHQALRIRKQLGGGMRQAGVLAAAGIVALEQMVDRLAEDHARARKLAESLQSIPGLKLPFGLPATNMVFAALYGGQRTAAQVAAELKTQGILVGAVAADRFRMVLHNWVDDEDVDRTVAAFRQVLAA